MVIVSLSSASDSDDVDEYGGNGSCGDDKPYEFRLPTAAAGTELSVVMTSTAAAAAGGGGEYRRRSNGGMDNCNADIISASLDEYPDNKFLSILLDKSFLLEDDSKGADETAQTLCHENSAGVGVAASAQSTQTLQYPQSRSQLPSRTIPLTEQMIMQELHSCQDSQHHFTAQQIYPDQQHRQQQQHQRQKMMMMMMMLQRQQLQMNLQLINQQRFQQDQLKQQLLQQHQQQLLFQRQQYSALTAMHNDKNNDQTDQGQWQKAPGQPTQISSDNVRRVNPSPVHSCAIHQQGQLESTTETMMMHNVPPISPMGMHSAIAASTTTTTAAAAGGGGSTNEACCNRSGFVSISSLFANYQIKCGTSDHLRDDDDFIAPRHDVIPVKRHCHNNISGGGGVDDRNTDRYAKRSIVQLEQLSQQVCTDDDSRHRHVHSLQQDMGDDKEAVVIPMTKDTIKCNKNFGSNFHYIQVVGGGALKRPRSSSNINDDDCRSMNSSSISSIGAASAWSSSSVASPCPQAITSSSSRLQDYLDNLLSSRGYRPKKLGAISLGYRPNPPTPLQLASFGYAVCSTTTKAALRPTKIKDFEGGAARLSALLRAGLSPNPTNKFGESPFFVACKHGSYSLVEAFVNAGAEVHVADGFGRTPLHYAAWADPPSMKAVRLLLDKRKKGCDAGPDDDKDSTDDNARLLYVTDAHGKTPLDFVGTNHHGMWIEFLEGIKDEYWPVQERNESSSDQRNVGEVGVEYFPSSRWKSRRGTDNVSNFSALDRNNDIPDPQNALPLELAQKVANGHMMPQEARRLIRELQQQLLR